MKTAIIVNPTSGGGKTAPMWASLRDQMRSRLGGTLEEQSTKGPGDATRMATQIAHSDAQLLVIAGGDGTINEVINGLFNEENLAINPELKIGILSTGRGCDFIRSVNIPNDPRKAVDVLLEPRFQKIDLGCCYFKDEFGREQKRLFANIACAGLAGRVAKQVNRTPRIVPAGLAYLASVATNFALSKPQILKVSVDDREVYNSEAINVFVANGGFSGAGMNWAPMAKVDDGVFEVIIGEPIPKITTLLQQHRLYDGTFIDFPGIHHHRGKKVEVTSLDDVLLEVDGEQPGLAPAVFTVLPGAINLAVK